MKIIVDSGGTSATWALLGKAGVQVRSGAGIQPYFQEEEEIARVAGEAAAALAAPVEALFFYGAGLEDQIPRQKVERALRQAFPRTRLELQTDMLGAARALYQHDKGVAAILGTGSNTCYYDGERAEVWRRGYGFILGDEGSGAALGRRLLRAYLYERMPSELQAAFRKAFPLSEGDFLQKVYQEPAPNRFLGSLAPFAGQWRAHAFMRELLDEHFGEFFDQMLEIYARSGHRKVSCVGSIAWHFREEIRACGVERGFGMGKILQNPMEGLVAYHQMER